MTDVVAPSGAPPNPDIAQAHPPTLRPSWQDLVRALREIALIVVGVLIALGANSWWESRERRARELLNLRSLLAATIENQERLNRAIRVDSVSSDLSRRVLVSLRRLGPPLPDSLEALVARAVRFSDYHPLTAAYIAPANSGELSEFRNRVLAAQIVRVAGEIAGKEQQIRAYDGVAESLRVSLQGFVDVVGATAEWESVLPYRVPGENNGPSRTPNSRELDPTPFGLEGASTSLMRPTWNARQATPDFEALLFATWRNSGNRLFILRTLRGELGTLRGALEEEVSR